MSRAAKRSWQQSLDRWSAVLRYHRPQQLARRIWNRVREELPMGDVSVEGPTPKVRTDVRDTVSHSHSPPFAVGEVAAERRVGGLTTAVDHTEQNRIPAPPPGSQARHLPPRRGEGNLNADALRGGKVRLLNREFALGWPPRWDDADREGLPLLAVFHLHYHEHLLKIITNEPEAVWTAISSWVDRFAVPDRTSAGWAAWHPYCISRRVFAWLKLLAIEPPEPIRSKMIDHLAKQARRLANRFERDIGGNHLWENARALAALGAFFDGDEADAWRVQGLSTLWQCIREQLSPEGEHFERSPMYQAELAHGLDELADVLQPVDEMAAERCRATAARMKAFLDGLRHPDGDLPLLGDTTRDEETAQSNPAFILHPSSFILSHHGDYFIHRSDRGFLLFDAGDVGPDHLPAHAHSDLLGFEASAFGQRLFVDSGVFAYQGQRREEFRKSAAHNVLTVDGVELADVWGSFRVGRRGHVISRRSGRGGGAHWIKAEHDAYRRMGVRVQRWWLIAEDGQVWISIHVVLGRGSKLLTERLHLHPEIDWTQNGRSITLKPRHGNCHWVSASSADFRTETTAYSERFYVEQPKTTLVMESQTELPAVSAWALVIGDGEIEASARIEESRLVVDWMSDGVERRFARGLDE